MGLSCLGTRGLLPLLANLARSFDQELLELHGFEEQLPAWLRVGGGRKAWGLVLATSGMACSCTAWLQGAAAGLAGVGLLEHCLPSGW